MALGGSLLQDRHPGEVHYYDTASEQMLSFFPNDPEPVQ